MAIIDLEIRTMDAANKIVVALETLARLTHFFG
jgi:hypothetical protein